MNKILSLFLLFIISCTRNVQDESIFKIEVDQVATEQQVPKAILQQLDAEFAEEFKVNPPLYTFMPLNISFKEAQSGVLLKPHVEYQFPKGGGVLDLKDILRDEGSFYMFFPKAQFVDDHELLHIFFVSQSPQADIDGEKFGLGCGKWNDLKSSFKKLQSPDFLKLNTTELRYLRVVAGHYVFVFKKAKSVYLTQVTLTDSRYQNQLCGSNS